MKRLNFLLLLLSAGLMSCGNSGKSSSSGTDTVAAAKGTADTSAAIDQGTRAFADKAATGGLLEVELGKLAQEKAQNKRVKAFGVMMVADHSKANDELKKIAAQKNITVSTTLTADQAAQLEKMKQKKGISFDKAYLKMMLSDHRKDIDEFERYSKNGSDAGIKEFALKTLPVLKMHLDSAKSINKEVKASVAPGSITEGTMTYPER